MEDKVRAHVVITGRVQGVFFRLETQKAVYSTGGVSGWVRNRSDGTVEAVFEGNKDEVEAIIQWCHKGSPHSNVENVEVKLEEYTGQFTGFDITG